ncbi:unannotated protein [freshwater metagenome]|uniref:Unannotated protein n=1 Tax=freshwater metagenome TaxID=449393 RepID=A0A6J7JHY3_9ZZZZ|nr:hypothetical protein [Actinomycetota bacterium]MSW36776.1 hypothetical protein [Actinomycetota bacterium]MSX38816.1 hypothetical protein [Actinomycetota bacterium]
MNGKKLTAVVALALAAGTLAACDPTSGPSWRALGFESRASASGQVSLKSSTVFNIAGLTDVRRTSAPGMSDTTARIETSANYSHGSWQIKGSWRDGLVRFTFEGWALDSLNNQINNHGHIPLAPAHSQDSAPRPSDHDGSWTKGGCTTFTTYYRSTNPSHPGTGIATVTLCDHGRGPSGFGSWAGPDTVAVSVWDTRTPLGANTYPYDDASPYVGYSAGGTMANDKVSVRSADRGIAPTVTPSPIGFTEVPQ